MTQPHAPSLPLRKLRLYCAGVGGLCTALLLAWTAHHLLDGKQVQFNDRATRLLDSVSTRLSASIAMTRSFRAFFDASDFVAADELQVFASSSFQNFGYAAAALYAPYVEQARRNDFEQSLAAAGSLATIARFDAEGGLVSSPAQPFYFPILYLETLAHTGKQYRGLDLQTAWADAIQESLSRDEVRAVPTPTPGGNNLFTLLAPVYQKNHTADVLAQTAGIVATVIDSPLLLDDVATLSDGSAALTDATLRIAFSAHSSLAIPLAPLARDKALATNNLLIRNKPATGYAALQQLNRFAQHNLIALHKA